MEAKAGLEHLVELAEAGQDTIIARSGEPVARLTGIAHPKKSIRYGALKGKIVIADDFDRLLVGQAIAEQMQFLTADPYLKQYSELAVQV